MVFTCTSVYSDLRVYSGSQEPMTFLSNISSKYTTSYYAPCQRVLTCPPSHLDRAPQTLRCVACSPIGMKSRTEDMSCRCIIRRRVSRTVNTKAARAAKNMRPPDAKGDREHNEIHAEKIRTSESSSIFGWSVGNNSEMMGCTYE
jgi:hypothetical protein